MKLSAIVAATPTTEQLLEYQNACATVNSYAYAIANTALPVLNQPPPDYGTFSVLFAPAKAHCVEWTSSIFPTMLSFPAILVTQASDLFNMEETMADAYLDELIQNPSDQAAKDGLQKALLTMQSIAQTQLDTAEGLLTSMNTFSTDITADAASLNTIATESLADAATDEADIQTLNAQIVTLKNEIKKLNKSLTAAEIGISVSLYVGLIGAVCCVIPGAELAGAGLIVIGVAGEAASITETVLLTQSIQAANAAIQADQQQIEAYNQDVVELQSTNLQFQWLDEANAATQIAIQQVITMWRELDAELTSVVEELTNSDYDATKEQYQAAQDDLNAAAAAWQEVIEFATALTNVTYNWQDADGTWHSYTSQPPGNSNATVAMLPSTVAA
jgi:peptidoglycan hydrolase CwlO-like protein